MKCNTFLIELNLSENNQQKGVAKDEKVPTIIVPRKTTDL
jgi:hypothetical protein